MSESWFVLVRHGQSLWNLENLFTGWKDPDLSPQGEREARAAGQSLNTRGIVFDMVFCSALLRSFHTLQIMLEELGQKHLIPLRDKALNERDYGSLSGMNKDEARAKWGADQVHLWRRSYDAAPPGGESLRQTRERVEAYYRQQVFPSLLAGKNVLLVAHGNSLRALLMVLENLDEKSIMEVEIPTAVPYLYRLGSGSVVLSKETLISAGGA